MEFQDLFRLAMKREVPEIAGWRGTETVLNLGGGPQQIPGAICYDITMGWNADVNFIPHAAETVDHVIMFHFLEHVADPIRMLREVERVLKPGGVATICVPYYTSQMNAHDLTHRSVFCEETWRNLFNPPYYTRGGPEWRFQIGFNLICGVVERNLCLLTQLVKV